MLLKVIAQLAEGLSLADRPLSLCRVNLAQQRLQQISSMSLVLTAPLQVMPLAGFWIDVSNASPPFRLFSAYA
jgi:hypothetical protein